MRFFLGLVVLGVLSAAGPAAEQKKAPLHVVVILADDLGSGDLGCYNAASKVPTPNLDRLAREGMRFTDAHTPSGVCTPTRYGLLTGRYCWRSRLKSGVLYGYDPCLIDEGRTTLASLLKKQGYATGGAGKWHLGLGPTRPTDFAKPLTPGPTTLGFDYYFGIPASLDMDPYLFFENEHPVEAATRTIGASEMRRKGGEGFWRAGKIAPSFKHSDVLPTVRNKALAWLEKQRKETPEKPVFLYLPLTAPHTPWLPTKEFEGKSKAGYYGDFVVQVDSVVGDVLQALKKLDMADNTLLFFTSDNGAHWTPEDIKKYGHRANNNWRGQKSDIWEGGHRVPFLVRWPGQVKPGSVSDEVICLTDILATTADVVGVKLGAQEGEDSVSILPALRGDRRDHPLREAVVHHSGNGVFAIRQGKWKLIEGLGSGGFSAPRTEKPTENGPKGQLYDLVADPQETRNLWKEHPEVVAKLGKLLKKYKDEKRSVTR